MKVLNLYAGIGGNRKLWEDVEVTAVEIKPEIATIYQDFFPNDKVVVADAHQYLLENFKDYDFIWSSPPCPTHSRLNQTNVYHTPRENNPLKIRYPDMKLYEEIILLKQYFAGKWCVENVISFYSPLIKPSEIGGHYYWSNFFIGQISNKNREHYGTIKQLQERKQFDLSGYSGIDKIKTLRNCVEPEVGLHILNYARKQEDDLFKIAKNG